MSSSASRGGEHDDRDRPQLGVCLISASTSRPSLRGRLRSSRIRSGRGASAYWPSRRRNCRACSPSLTTCRRLLDLVVLEGLPGHEDVTRVVLHQQDVDHPGLVVLSHRLPRLGSSVGGFPVVSASGSCPGLVRRLGRHGQREPEPRAFRIRRVEPDAPPWNSMIFLAQGQADAGAPVGLLGVQALEDDEDAVGVLGLDADAVVGDGEEPELARRLVQVTTIARRLAPLNLSALPIRFWKTAVEQRRLGRAPAAGARISTAAPVSSIDVVRLARAGAERGFRSTGSEVGPDAARPARTRAGR